MDKDPSTLLRELKLATGWSETRLAAELRTSQPTVNRILNGQARCLSTTLGAIAGLHAKQCGSVERRSSDKPLASVVAAGPIS
ncbi:helix-turn-helix domain-containing protein [Massilia timonae]|uniref:helix-turn-helix domain-containing protein n=1 Tax=Massilia timonae TaxID=47229 RepID=UPI00351CDF1D